MRLVFAGTPSAAVPSLTALIESSHEVVAVVTRPDAPSGRGRKLLRSPVAAVADEAGIKVLTPTRPSDPDFAAELANLAPDCIPVVAYGALIGADLLALPRHGWVNLHFSLLPAWRGAAPVQHAIWHGDDITGATTFALDPGMDTGPIYGVVTETIRPHDTAGDLLGRLSESGAVLLAATLDGIADGALVAQPQPAEGISYAPKIVVDDARINWHDPAPAVDRLVRATDPAPGAWTEFRGERLKLGRVTTVDVDELEPGELRVDKRRVLVGTATSAVELGEVKAVGKRAMSAPDWARGVRPEAAERLG